MTVAQFAASLAMGILSVLLPLIAFISLVAVFVYIARWWIDRHGKS
jgi:hypothetical protein